MSLRSYIARRIVNMFILILAVLVFNFFIFRLPVFLLGVDPADLVVPPDPRLREQYEETLRQNWGIPEKNAPIEQWIEHFQKYMINMLTFNFGYTFGTGGKGSKLVVDQLMERLPNTVLLLGTASITTIILGVVLGVWAATRVGSKTDMTLVSSSLTLYALPIFWLGMLALMIFGVYLKVYPVSAGTMSERCMLGQCGTIEMVLDYIYHLTLPVAVLTVGGFGGYLLLMRNNLLDVLTEDYITTARAKGLPERTVLYKHAMKNAILPMITVIALSFAFVISGAVLTETVFNWHGMGRYILEAVINQDWPASQATFYLIAIVVIVANFIADILYGVLDPRVKYA